MRATIFTVATASPGKLSTMARPRGGEWLADEMAALRDAGTDIVVCMLTPSELVDLSRKGTSLSAAKCSTMLSGSSRFPAVSML